MKWEIVEQREIHHGFFRLRNLKLRHALFSGGISGVLVRELFERSNAVAVLPYDPQRDEVVLIEQFRTGAIDSPQGPWLVEIVAGLIESGETAEEVARREALEESGCSITALQHLYDYYVSPGGFAEQVSMYVGRVNSENLGGIHGVRSEGEDIRVMSLTSDEAFEKLDAGEFRSSLPIIALLWLRQNRQKLMDKWS